MLHSPACCVCASGSLPFLPPKLTPLPLPPPPPPPPPFHSPPPQSFHQRGEFSTLLLTLLKLASLAVWLLIRLDDLIQCRAQPVVLVVIMAEWVVAQDLRCESLRDVLLMRPAPENTVSMLALAARPASLGRPTPLYVTKEGNRVLIFHIARNATDRKKRWRCGKGRRNRQISTGAYSQDHIHTQPSQHSSIECH